jgi:hypothetical protein
MLGHWPEPRILCVTCREYCLHGLFWYSNVDGDDLKHRFRRELRYDAFAFAVTLAVGGGAAVERVLRTLDGLGCCRLRPGHRLSELLRTFISNILSSTVTFSLLQSG